MLTWYLLSVVCGCGSRAQPCTGNDWACWGDFSVLTELPVAGCHSNPVFLLLFTWLLALPASVYQHITPYILNLTNNPTEEGLNAGRSNTHGNDFQMLQEMMVTTVNWKNYVYNVKESQYVRQSFPNWQFTQSLKLCVTKSG